MVSTSARAAAFHAAIAVTFTITTPAFSQAPTDAQRSAIRAQCRSDYEAHCASIPPGGAASLQCLQNNVSSLSPGCQSAVRAVEAPSEAKSEPAAAAAPAKPEAAPDTAAKAEPGKPAAERQAAEQRPGQRNTRRLPRRLFKRLRRRSNRRRACIAVPGEQ